MDGHHLQSQGGCNSCGDRAPRGEAQGRAGRHAHRSQGTHRPLGAGFQEFLEMNTGGCSVPSVWTWPGLPGVCLWQCFWGNRLCLYQREETMFGGKECSLSGQITPPAHLPSEASGPWVPAAWSPTSG